MRCGFRTLVAIPVDELEPPRTTTHADVLGARVGIAEVGWGVARREP
jgi:hypothetical protein